MHHTRHSDVKHLPALNVKLQSVRRALSSVCALIFAGFNETDKAGWSPMEAITDRDTLSRWSLGRLESSIYMCEWMVSVCVDMYV